MNLKITPAARKALLALVRDSGLSDPYVTIVAGTDREGKHWGWNVGLYAKDRVTPATTPDDWILEIEGLRFAIDVNFQAKLDGRTLDLQNGHFRVRE